ncbi:hypothetical protein DKL61_02515 [Gammaproteobacteria bacterium ESL0073]|nr:hypothetical protein DKL61_02515 [Gammaproteobacteria bacterium ESL0073]
MVGIYDTVASHGWEHNNDSKYFELDIGAKQQIKKIVHITAQNEYRNHFSLVQINSSLSAQNANADKSSPLSKTIGFQCSLPGAHADIGGGYIKKYHDGGKEPDLYLSNYDPPTQWNTAKDKGEIYWQWYVKKGYFSLNPSKYFTIRANQSAYKTQQNLLAKAKQTHDEKVIKINEDLLADAQEKMESSINEQQQYILPRQETTKGELSVVKKWGGYYEVRANRTVNGNAYQYIPLKLMQILAEDSGVAKFTHPIGLPEIKKVYSEVSADPILAKFNAYVTKQGLAQYKTAATFDFHPINADLTEAESQYMYHEYIHASLAAEIRYRPSKYFGNYVTNGSQYYNQDYNKELDAFEPRRVLVLDNAEGVYNQSQQEKMDRLKQQETSMTATATTQGSGQSDKNI